MVNNLECSLSKKCGNCPLGSHTYQETIKIKQDYVNKLFKDASINKKIDNMSIAQNKRYGDNRWRKGSAFCPTSVTMICAYMYPLLLLPKEQHLFKQGVVFGKVMMLYHFDKKLRYFYSMKLKRSKVAVRCAIVNFGTEMTGNPFWMTDANNSSIRPSSIALYVL